MSTPTTCWLRLRTTPEQRQALRTWFAAASWAYNRALQGIRDGEFPVNEASSLLVSMDVEAQELHGTVPAGIVYHAAREAVADVLRKRSVGMVCPRAKEDRILSCPIVRDAILRILPVPAPVRPQARAHVFLESLGPAIAKGPTGIMDRLISDGGLRHPARLLLHRRRGGMLYLVFRMHDMARTNCGKHFPGAMQHLSDTMYLKRPTHKTNTNTANSWSFPNGDPRYHNTLTHAGTPLSCYVPWEPGCVPLRRTQTAGDIDSLLMKSRCRGVHRTQFAWPQSATWETTFTFALARWRAPQPATSGFKRLFAIEKVEMSPNYTSWRYPS